MTNRVLSTHFARVKSKLIEFSRHFEIADHGDIKGFGREALVDEFLQTHLPDQIEFLTGEILDKNDARSGQVDIILQSKMFPKIPLLGRTHLVFSDAVMAAIEVKSDLNKAHLLTTLKQFQKIKGLERNTVIRGGQKQHELKKTPCVIFAFKGMSLQKLGSHIDDFAKTESVSWADFAPDLVVVLKGNYYFCRNDGWIVPINNAEETHRSWKGSANKDADEDLVGIYSYLYNITQSFLRDRHQVDLGPYFQRI